MFSCHISCLLSSKSYWRVICRCNFLWINIWCRSMRRRDIFVYLWFWIWDTHRRINTKFINWYWIASWRKKSVVLCVKCNYIWYCSITLVYPILYTLPLSCELLFPIMTDLLIYSDVMKGWRPINNISVISKLLFGVPISIDIEKMNSYCLNFTVVVSLENNYLKQIIKNQMKLWRNISSA